MRRLIAALTLVGLAVASGLLAGCAGKGQTIEALGPLNAGQIEYIDDPFKPFEIFSAPSIGIRHAKHQIRATLVARRYRAHGNITATLEIEIAYLARQRRNYHKARNANAEALKLFKVASRGRSKNGKVAALSELINVVIPPIDLRRAGDGGYRLKVFGKLGDEALITIPSPMIKALFGRIASTTPSKARAPIR